MDTTITMNKGDFYHLMRNAVPFSWTKVKQGFMVIEDGTLTVKVTPNYKILKPHAVTVPVQQEGPNVQCAFSVDNFKKIKTTKARPQHNYTIRVTGNQVLSLDFKVPFTVEECSRDNKMNPLAEFFNFEIGDVLAGVSVCTDKEEYGRPVLHGVNIRRDSFSEVGLASADGFRMAVGKLFDYSAYRKNFDFIMPVQIIETLVDYLSRKRRDNGTVIELWEGTKSVGFRVVEVIKKWQSDEEERNLIVAMRSDKIQGNFPNYNQLIPHEPKNSVTFNAPITTAFCEASRKFISKDVTPILRFRFGREENKIEMSTKYNMEDFRSSSPDAELKTTLDIKNHRHDAKDTDYYRIAFNTDLLQPVIESIIPFNHEMVWEGSGQSVPAIIRPVDTECLMFVVMPMFVQWED